MCYSNLNEQHILTLLETTLCHIDKTQYHCECKDRKCRILQETLRQLTVHQSSIPTSSNLSANDNISPHLDSESEESSCFLHYHEPTYSLAGSEKISSTDDLLPTTGNKISTIYENWTMTPILAPPLIIPSYMCHRYRY